MRECEGYLGQMDFDRIIREVYGEIPSPISNTDSESLSSGFLDTQIEATRSLIDKEVLGYNHNIINKCYISKLCSNTPFSSSVNEEDVILAPCVNGESVCLTRTNGVSDEHFYFYSGVIDDFKIRVPFIDFESDLLKTLSIAPSQLCPNGWGFIKDFEIICDTMDIMLTLGLFSHFSS